MPINPDDRARAAPARDVYSVSRVNREVRALLERGLGVLWVEGELSNFSQPASGHWYFSLKDRDAQLRCAMFRMQNSLVGFTPRAGTQVLVRGRISVYEARGEYQLVVEHLEESGTSSTSPSRTSRPMRAPPPPRVPRSWWCRRAARASSSWRAARNASPRVCAANCASMARASRTPSGA